MKQSTEIWMWKDDTFNNDTDEIIGEDTSSNV